MAQNFDPGRFVQLLDGRIAQIVYWALSGDLLLELENGREICRRESEVTLIPKSEGYEVVERA